MTLKSMGLSSVPAAQAPEAAVCMTASVAFGLWHEAQRLMLSVRFSPCRVRTLWQVSHLAISTMAARGVGAASRDRVGEVGALHAELGVRRAAARPVGERDHGAAFQGRNA